MDLSTTYMGLKLKSPVVPSANPLVRKADKARALEDAGAAAITMYSLFEEQIRFAQEELAYFLERGTNRFAESLDYYPETAADYTFGPEEYLKRLAQVKEAVDVPVIASLNGSTPGGWMDYARQMEQAGADALEINLYALPTDDTISGEEVERTYVDILKAVKGSISVPVAMKLSPYFSSMAHMARRLDEAGADGLVLFNRFYQPVIDIEELEVRPQLVLSHEEEARLPTRRIAILYGRVRASLALTSGIHTPGQVVQGIMAGASVVNVCSAILKEGPQKIGELLAGLREWMESHEYESVQSMRGILSQKSCPDPQAFERANYMKTLNSFRELPAVPH